MRKIIILAVFALLAVVTAMPHTSSAAYNDATLTTDAVISVGGINLNVSGASAVVSSITVGASSFSFNLESGSSLQVTSTAGKVLTTDSLSYVTVNTCTNNQSVLKHASTNNSVLVTITPQSYNCGISATNSGTGVVASGGGGGGSSIYTAPVFSNEVVPGCPIGFICTRAPKAVTASGAAPAGTGAVFTAHMAFGARSTDVSRLQKLLASDTSVYPEGLVTGYFGPLTRKAVENFQVKYKVAKKGDPGFGTVGPLTRAALKKVYGGQ